MSVFHTSMNVVAMSLYNRFRTTITKKKVGALKMSGSSFWTVFYSLLILMMSTNLPSPLYRLYQERFGFSPLVLTLIFAIYAVVLLPSLPLFGKASDRYGRKRLVSAGVFVSIFASVLFALADHVWMLFSARALQGVAVGMLSGAASAALMELNPYPNKQAAALASSIATAGGTAIGPLLGGIIAEYIPFSFISPFAAHWILVLPSLIGLIGLRETVKCSENAARDKPVDTLSLSRQISGEQKRLFATCARTAMTAWAVTALFMSVIPSYIAALLGIANLAFAGGVVCLMLGSSVMIQLIARKADSSRSMLSGHLILCLGLSVIVIAVPLDSAASLLLGTVAAGVGQGLAFKGAMQLVNELAPAQAKAKLLSKLFMHVYIGVGVPIIGVGLLSAYYGLFHAVLIFAVTIGAVSLILAGQVAGQVARQHNFT